MAKVKKASTTIIQPRLRVRVGGNIALGPGKVELLSRIGETGSISEGARLMGMSYMRAWTLIKTMNAAFKAPVIEAARGGEHGGGAQLTRTGRRALEIYQHMESASLTAIKDDWRNLRKLLRS